MHRYKSEEIWLTFFKDTPVVKSTKVLGNTEGLVGFPIEFDVQITEGDADKPLAAKDHQLGAVAEGPEKVEAKVTPKGAFF